jgi:hypothetical protein
MLRRLVGACLAALLGLSLAACDSLPKNLERQAETLEKNIDALDAAVATRETEYAAARKAPTWSFYAPYAQRENWQGEFGEARTGIQNLRAAYDRQIAPILGRDESKDAEALRTALTQVGIIHANTTKQVNFVRDRMTLLTTGRRLAQTWRNQAVAASSNIDAIVSDVQPVLQKAKLDFPNRSADIDKRFIPLRGLQEGATRARQVVETQFAKHTANSGADYAAFADAYTLIQRNAQTATAENTRYRAALASLSREYSLIIRDMKIEYDVTIGRSSWDESSDWGEQDTTYAPVRISKSDYDYLAALPEDQTLASYGTSWGSWKGNADIDANVWNRLNIDMHAGWPDSSHNSSQFYIHEIEPIYFHKYAEVNGKTVTERNWEVVDDEDFGQHANDFGMAIRTKKLGQFEDEVVDEATPPGMEMVGDPRYGNWVSDGNGGQRWSFLEMYAVYALLTGGNNSFYGRGDYDSYRRWRDERDRNGGVYGWYGANRSAPIYGSTGSATKSSANYRNSPFSRVGGVSAVPNDVRQAGSSARSRGPGSRGK